MGEDKVDYSDPTVVDMEKAGYIAILRDDAGRARAYKLRRLALSDIGILMPPVKNCAACHGTGITTAPFCNCIVMHIETGVK